MSVDILKDMEMKSQSPLPSADRRLIREAVLHIRSTKRPSVNDAGDCIYGGAGCAFAPAIKPEYRGNAMIENMGPTTLLNNFSEYLYEWARECHPVIAQQVQGAHDEIIAQYGDKWYLEGKFEDMFENNLMERLKDASYVIMEIDNETQ